MSHAQSVIANPGLLGRVLDWIRTRCGEPGELATWSREELRELAADLSLNEADLVALSSSMADNTVLMERTIRAYGFEPEHLWRSFAPLLHDVERVCSRCHSTGRCELQDLLPFFLIYITITIRCYNLFKNIFRIKSIRNSERA